MPNRHKACLFLILANAIWGLSFPIAKPALTHITSLDLLLLRYLIGAPILSAIAVFTHKSFRMSIKTLIQVILLESLSMIAILLMYKGLSISSSIQTGLLSNARPIFVTLIGIFLLHELEEKHEWVGLIISFIGTLLISLSPLLNHQGIDDGSLYGSLLIIGANLLMATKLVIGKSIYHKLSKISITTISAWVGVMLYTFIAISSASLPSLHSLTYPSVITAVFYMGTLGLALAFILQFKGYDLIEASEASLFRFLQPLFYIPVSIIILKESVHPLQIVGLIIVLLGVFIAERRTNTFHIYHHNHH